MQSVVFIADVIENHNNANNQSNDLECITSHYFTSVMNALQEIHADVYHYNNLIDFIDNISMHKNDKILSLWSGTKNINRKMLVPSICEAYHLQYVGANAFVHSICQDKCYAKTVAAHYGIHGAKDILINHPKDIKYVQDLKFPIVVKPNFEGGSIGISSNNLVHTYEDAKKKISELLAQYNQSIIAEEYLPGTEISITIVGSKNQIQLFNVVSLDVSSNNKYPIFSYETKKKNSHRFTRKVFDGLPIKIIEQCKQLFLDLGKVDILRIDGKIYKNNFHLIELSPDASLSPNSSVANCFYEAGYSYSEMFKILLTLE